MAMNKDFGGFHLEEKIGSGGMASVYRAVQKSLQRQVVLKILYPHLAEDEKLVARFEREARAAAMMRHENIIQVIDCGREDDMVFIAMEFVEGMDLKKWLDAHGTPPLEMALLMLHDLCRGLEHAHGHRIVHRDIKPANLMLTPDGTIKLMDFGLARGGSETATQMTMVGSVLGTPAYMSPEQATGEVVDERADIFSAGVVAYELLGGQRPFAGDSYSTVLREILTVEPRDLTQFNPLVSPDIARLVRGMLEKDAHKRTASIAQVREELGAIIEQMGLTRWRDLLREYVADPDGVGARYRKKRLARHLDQGIYFENMGLGKIDDALLEFRRVLHLDPDNAAAREHVQKLERERDKLVADAAAHAQAAPPPDMTVVMPPPAEVPPAAKAAPPPPPPPAAKPAPPPPRRSEPSVLIEPEDDSMVSEPPRAPARGKSGLPLPIPVLAGIGVVLVALVVVLLVMLGRGGDSTPEPPRSADRGAAPDGGSIAPSPVPLPAPVDTTHAAPEPPLEQARALYAANDYAQAASVLRQAIAERSIPRGDLRAAQELLARAYVRAGRRSDATKIYADILKASPAYTLNASETSSADRAAFDAAKQVAGGEPKPAPPPAPTPAPEPAPAPSGGPARFVILATPFASELTLDGERKDGNKPRFELSVPPGHHVIAIKHPSLGRKEWTVDATAGEKRELSHDFIKSSAGTIRVTAEGGWAEVYVDGQSSGRTTPATIEGVLPGEHVVSLVSDSYTVEGGPRVVQVKVGEQVSVQFKLKSRK